MFDMDDNKTNEKLQNLRTKEVYPQMKTDSCRKQEYKTVKQEYIC